VTLHIQFPVFGSHLGVTPWYRGFGLPWPAPALEHGGGGELEIAEVVDGNRKGIRLCFSDKGPGIADVKQALTDGFTSKQGMGLGLGGSKRLMNEFDIQTAPGEGTTVTVTRWK